MSVLAMHKADEDKPIFWVIREDKALEKMLFKGELDIEYLYFNNIIGMLYKGDFLTYEPTPEEKRFGIFDRALPVPGFDMEDNIFMFSIDNVKN